MPGGQPEEGSNVRMRPEENTRSWSTLLIDSTTAISWSFRHNTVLTEALNKPDVETAISTKNINPVKKKKKSKNQMLQWNIKTFYY